MTSVFHRFPHAALPMAERGEGVYLYDNKGKQYLDASGGAAVSIIGHGHKAVLEAMHQQLDRLAFAHTAFFTNEPAEQLAAHLAAQTPNGISKVYFLSGGSEANEAALKLARQYFVAKGEDRRRIFIHRQQSYHGNTLGALSVSGNGGRRKLYEPILMPSPAIAPCYAYRHQQAQESDADYARRAAGELETEILHQGPENVAAFIAEPIVGATLGAVPALPGYFARIREICDRYGVLLIFDEVMCGMGRSGKLFAAQSEGVTPDIITIAKGLAGGYQPIGAMLVSDEIFSVVTQRQGYFEHGHTYIGHALACAAALAVQQILQDGLLASVPQISQQLFAGLHEAFDEHPHIGDIRGRGLLLGIELVAERDSKRPFPAELKLAKNIKGLAMENGLMCYPGSGCADGVLGDHILLAPSYIFTPAHIDELISKLSKTLAQALPQ